MRKTRLTLCMIVKNEEAVLARCLKSVVNLVDEIVIVDTGSTDGTKQVAEAFGAKVFNYSWDDNFSTARNFSLDQASGEWILTLDADEVLSYESREECLGLLIDQEVEGYFIRIVNILGKPQLNETSEDLVVRLFRNNPSYRFTGVIHEQVRQSITTLSGEHSLRRAPLVIYHDGYLAPVMEKKAKVSRNSAVIRKALLKNPKEPFLLYSLGCESFISGDFKGAGQLFQQALALNPVREGYLPDLVIKMGLCLFKLGQAEEMRKLITVYRERFPASPELLFLSGIANLNSGNIEVAEKDIINCMAGLREYDAALFGIKHYQVYQALGDINEAKGTLDQALRFYHHALKAYPQYLYPLSKIIVIYKYHKPSLKIHGLLRFCSPETKLSLLIRLNWSTDTDFVVFILLGILQDIIDSDLVVSQILGHRLNTLLDQKLCRLEKVKVVTVIYLAKAMLSLTGYKALGIKNAEEACDKIFNHALDILLLAEGKNGN